MSVAGRDYARDSWEFRAHHERFKRHVESMPRKLVCQDCGGMGGETEAVLDFGEGPWYSCGWCEGTGFVPAHRRGEWLRMRRGTAA